MQRSLVDVIYFRHLLLLLPFQVKERDEDKHEEGDN